MMGANVNSIAQVKTVTLESPKGLANAIMMAANIDDPATVEEFVQQVAEQFKVHRMLAPPDTSCCSLPWWVDFREIGLPSGGKKSSSTTRSFGLSWHR
jgi:hypothetical protein